MQTDCEARAIPVSTEPTFDVRRSVGMHRAAQVLADATRCRQGLAPVPLNRLPPDEREWFKQAARNTIEIFETLTKDREPDDVAAARTREAERIARALQERLSQERSRGRFMATERGHDLTAFGPYGTIEGDERAVCRRCVRPVIISLGEDPVLSGSALEEGCLVSTKPSDPREQDVLNHTQERS